MEKEVDAQERPKKKSGRWGVGVSGNPEGDAPWAWHQIVRNVAMQQRQDKKENRLAAAEALFDEAVEKRNVAAIKEIGDRLDGKAPQAIEMTGKDGGTIDTTITLKLVKVEKSVQSP